MATNKKTLLQAIKTKLIAATWSGSSNVVFPTGSVRIARYMEVDYAYKNMRTPFCLIIPGNFSSDPLHNEEPDYYVGSVTIRLGVYAGGDTISELTVLGGHRADSTKSEGAGLEDLAEVVQDTIGLLTVEDGIDMQFDRDGDNGAVPLPATQQYMAYQDLLFNAICTAT